MRRRRDARNDRGTDAGNAVIEFVFVAVVMLIPLIYLIVAVVTVQRAQAAVTTAAREAGRAFATSGTASSATARASGAAQIAFTDAGLSTTAPYFVAFGASCDAARIQPRLAPGARFTVCVRRTVDVPAVPTLLQGKGITVVGRYNVQVDEFRTVP